MLKQSKVDYACALQRTRKVKESLVNLLLGFTTLVVLLAYTVVRLYQMWSHL